MTDEYLDAGDTRMTCVECDRTWIFTAKNRAFFLSRDLQMPKRCLPCRAANRQRKAGAIFTGTHEPVEWR